MSVWDTLSLPLPCRTFGIPSRMGLILDLSPRTLEKVLYFANYIVLDAGDTKLQYKQVLTEKEYQDAREEFGNSFRAGMGAESIKELLMAIDLEKERQVLKILPDRREPASSRDLRLLRHSVSPETVRSG